MRNVSIEKSDAEIAHAATSPPVKVGTRRRARSNIGSRIQASTATNAARRSAAAPSEAMTVGDPQPSVSEASVYYHYTDKAGLLRAVFLEGLQPLRDLNDRGIGTGDRTQTLTRVARAIE